jgi:uncharacterized membrane protein
MKDKVVRTVVKTIFFKIITTSATALIVGIKGAILIHLIMTAIYLVYERVWNKINWGRKPEKINI